MSNDADESKSVHTRPSNSFTRINQKAIDLQANGMHKLIIVNTGPIENTKRALLSIDLLIDCPFLHVAGIRIQTRICALFQSMKCRYGQCHSMICLHLRGGFHVGHACLWQTSSCWEERQTFGDVDIHGKGSREKRTLVDRR